MYKYSLMGYCYNVLYSFFKQVARIVYKSVGLTLDLYLMQEVNGSPAERFDL